MARHHTRSGLLRRLAAGLALACLLGWPGGLLWAQAQAPGAAPGAAPAAVPAAAPAAGQGAAPAAIGPAVGASFVRLTLLSLDQLSYTQHPAAAITGNALFDNGHAAFGDSFNIGAPSSDHSASLGEQLFHSLPPFGVEWGQGLGLFLPKAYSLGFDYYSLPQTEEGITGKTNVPSLKLDTYLYNFAVRLFAFDPTQPGI
ncbi:MAG TPA: hypothetical protein VL359_04335, partial [bacterium]|nr:hypothetical protein [bacterium]